MRNKTSDKLALTPEEVAKRLGISMPTIYHLCSRKGFPAVRVGRKIIIPLNGLERWLDEQTRGEGA